MVLRIDGGALRFCWRDERIDVTVSLLDKWRAKVERAAKEPRHTAIVVERADGTVEVLHQVSVWVSFADGTAVPAVGDTSAEASAIRRLTMVPRTNAPTPHSCGCTRYERFCLVHARRVVCAHGCDAAHTHHCGQARRYGVDTARGEVRQAEERRIVELVRELRAGGESLRSIVTELAQRGHRTRKGGFIALNQVVRLVRALSIDDGSPRTSAAAKEDM